MNKLDKPLNTNERYLYEINLRLNVLIDMMDSFLDVYSNQEELAMIEELEGQVSIYEDVEEYDKEIDYNNFTISELKEMLNEFDIEYKANMRKSELIGLIRE